MQMPCDADLVVGFQHGDQGLESNRIHPPMPCKRVEAGTG